MKLTTILLLFVFMGAHINAQQKISYTYDNAGNRIEKLIVLTKSSTSDVKIESFTEKINERTVEISPSPSGGEITVKISSINGMENGSIQVYSFPNGYLVHKIKITSTTEELDINNQSSGIYILNINIDGIISTWKILKK